ncbi:kelch repeat protein-like protein [Pyronema domesticum]|uniref:Similar to Nitrile-specifier protein 5 acc. no. Q93XW5 n=1 Tax=Pyronema omphalodes (strain CBS 100304) TaxID=1076935 RepID=U4L9H3_PYROM|nr:kelch repeat protein-like protein [Pyronema domesticum]CCX15236.1 Similar to Nitrile-specifier protein 5; acc. no. Q93XW5 [Pyronema omphalodes CBS 100304]
MSLSATFRQLANTLPRSSHALALHGNTLIAFAGEEVSRQPVAPDAHFIDITNPELSHTSRTFAASPASRVGAAYASNNGTLYIHGGRGGFQMTCLPEAGTVHVLNLATNTWASVHATGDHPEERSYHCATADDEGRVYLHAGCAQEAGKRLKDLWRWDQGTWEKLEDAPGAPRGGTSICAAWGKVYRMGGFDGKSEVGGGVDVFDATEGTWTTPEQKDAPRATSVACLLPVEAKGKRYLVSVMGEGEPSDKGHEGAGRFHGDVWAYDVEENTWSEVQVKGEKPERRGWFAAVGDGEKVYVHGGLGENNERLGDAWVLEFEQ